MKITGKNVRKLLAIFLIIAMSITVTNSVWASNNGKMSEEEILEFVSETQPIAAQTAAIQATSGSANVVVMLTAGHCARHTGGAANGFIEHELNFRVREYARQELQRYAGVTVLVDRPTVQCRWPHFTTWQQCVSERVRYAHSRGADLFVDLHFNIGGGAHRGSEIFVQNPSNPQIHQQSRQAANAVLTQLARISGLQTTRGVRWHNDLQFITNRLSTELGMNSMLIEYAFMDNAQDAVLIRNPGFLRQLGVATATGIANHYGLSLAVPGGGGGTTLPPPPPRINYSVHSQNLGWLPFVSNGAQAGTTGRSLRKEAIRINIQSSIPGGVEYRTHVQDVGWQGWRRNNEISGTTGRSLRLEALELRLTGQLATRYDIWYRVHIQNFGWLGWARNGARAGSAGMSLRMEAVQIRLVPRGGAWPGSPEGAFRTRSGAVSGTTLPAGGGGGTTPPPPPPPPPPPQPQAALSVNYNTHLAGIGWQGNRTNGAISGTTGQSRRMEAIRINLANTPVAGGVRYQVFARGLGWLPWVSDGNQAGTTGQARPLDGIRIELTGAIASQFHVEYRVHQAGHGWLSWVRNGATAGWSMQGQQLEAIEIRLVRR